MSVAVLDDDLEYVEAMMKASGAASFNSLLLSALYHFGQHLECGVPTKAFDLVYRRKIGSKGV
jgi:hypothetical protein